MRVEPDVYFEFASSTEVFFRTEVRSTRYAPTIDHARTN